MTSAATISGLASGIQWQDMIDQIMSLESQRQLDPLTARASADQDKRSVWTDYRTLVNKLSAAAATLRDGTSFDAIKVSAGVSPTNSRPLFTATGSAAATAGAYRVEVLALAQAEKVGGSAFTGTTTAANASGDFLINGRRIQVAGTDSLSAIRDKINAANSGTSPTGVTATILSTSATSHRLILTSNATGAAGIELVDGDSHALRTLGLLSGDSVASTTATGGSQSNRVTSATAGIAALLGVTSPPPSTIKVGGKSIAVDLTVDSLASIAAKINAAGVSASVVTETSGSTTYSRLSVGASISADVTAGTDPDGSGAARALALLGFTHDSQGSVAQTLRTETQLTDSVTGVAASGAALVTDLRSLGSANGLQAGDTITIRGARGDGSSVALDFAVTGTTTLDDLVAALNDPASGFGSASRGAIASIDNGQLVLTDSAGGDSQLSLSMTTSRVDSLDFGRAQVETTGFSRQISAGTDSLIRIDGAVVSRSSNTVTDALAGVTLNLLQAEAGATVDLSLQKDTDATVGAVQAYAAAYNAVQSFVKTQTASGASMAYDGSLRSSMGTFTSAMLTDVVGLSGTGFYRSAFAGLALTKTGTLELDADKLRATLASNPDDVRKLFGESGTPSDGRVSYVNASANTKAGNYDVLITALASAPTLTGSVLAGGYVDDGTPDQMTVTDSVSGKLVTIDLANGDTIDQIAERLNTGFQSDGLRLTAVNDGGALRITGTDVGSATKFTIAYDTGASATAQLGLAAGTYAGTDVQGTIGGEPATGSANTLTGAVGKDMEGLVVRYTGDTTGAAGQVAYVLGVGGMMSRATDAITRSGDGLVDAQIGFIDSRAESLASRADDVQQRLDLRRAALVKQFTAMETAMSRIQSQQSWLTSQINALSSNVGN